MSVRSAGRPGRSRHPSGIYLIFTTEIWERFSYFGMRGLLVLFLTAATEDGGFGWDGSSALQLYALYTGLVYLAPVLGGYLGDRILGRRRAVVTGCALMTAGHFTMALPAAIPWILGWLGGYPLPMILERVGVPLGHAWDAAYQGAAYRAAVSGLGLATPPEGLLVAAYLGTSLSFYAALALIIAGTGFFKSNMATMVGELYQPDDSRRDAGYTIYYTGANIGAFAANIVAGTIGEAWGWHYGFSVAGLGMAAGLWLFLRLAPRHLKDVGERPRAPGLRPAPLAGSEVRRVLGILLMSSFTILFWMGFEQGGGLLNLMIRESVDRSAFGGEVPATWFQSLNPLFLMLLAPLFVAFWGYAEDRGLRLHPTRKYAFGLLLMGLSFLVLLGAQGEIARTGHCSPWWVVAVFAIQTVGELAMSPVSKSLVSRYAPARIASPLMGAEFACYACGAWLAGMLGARAFAVGPEQTFMGISAVCLAAALVCLCLRRTVDRLLGEAPQPAATCSA